MKSCSAINWMLLLAGLGLGALLALLALDELGLRRRLGRRLSRRRLRRGRLRGGLRRPAADGDRLRIVHLHAAAGRIAGGGEEHIDVPSGHAAAGRWIERDAARERARVRHLTRPDARAVDARDLERRPGGEGD